MNQFPNVTVIGEEGACNVEVPSDWLVTEGDQNILQLNCPKEFQSATDKDVRYFLTRNNTKVLNSFLFLLLLLILILF